MVVSRSAKTVLIYPRGGTLVIGMIGLVFCGSLALLPALPSEYVPQWIRFPTTRSGILWCTGVSGAFALLCAYLVASYFWERHELSVDGIVSRSILGGRKTLKWSDIRSARYCQYPKAYFRLEGRSGTVIRISSLYPKFPIFAQLTLQRAPDASLDATSKNILRAVSFGFPPPMRLD